MSDPNFIALAFTGTEKQGQMQKLDHKLALALIGSEENDLNTKTRQKFPKLVKCRK